MLQIVSRRTLIRNSRMAAAVLVLGTNAASRADSAVPPSLDAFMAMSAKITGYSSLDRDMGKSILDALLSSGWENDVAALITDPAPERSKLQIASAVVAAWYSGISPSAGAREVTGFNEALVWNALSYTKPWGSCGGDLGYWGAPPDQEQ